MHPVGKHSVNGQTVLIIRAGSRVAFFTVPVDIFIDQAVIHVSPGNGIECISRQFRLFQIFLYSQKITEDHDIVEFRHIQSLLGEKTLYDLMILVCKLLLIRV